MYHAFFPLSKTHYLKVKAEKDFLFNKFPNSIKTYLKAEKLFKNGEKLFKKKNLEPSLSNLSEAVSLSWELKTYEFLAQCFSISGNIAYEVGNYKMSVDCFNSITYKTKDLPMSLSATNRLSLVALAQGNSELAKKYSHVMIKGLNDISDENFRTNINGCANYNIGEACMRESKWDEAITHLQNAKNLFSNANSVSAIAKCNLALGSSLSSLKKYYEAIEYLKIALPVFKSKRILFEESACLRMTGNIYGLMGYYKNAISYLKMAKKKYSKLKDLQMIQFVENEINVISKMRN